MTEEGDERQPSHSRLSERSTTSRESTSIHVQVPENVQPGETLGSAVQLHFHPIFIPFSSIFHMEMTLMFHAVSTFSWIFRKFFVVVDGMEYEVWAPEDSSPGEMVAMEIYSNPAESRLALQASRERSQAPPHFITRCLNHVRCVRSTSSIDIYIYIYYIYILYIYIYIIHNIYI